MNELIKKQWIEALRSGNYKQGKAYLRKDDEFCCLGVLCDIHSKISGEDWIDGFYINNRYVLPQEVIEWAGLKDREIKGKRGSNIEVKYDKNIFEFKEHLTENCAITRYNDGSDIGFFGIADIIEKEL